MLVLFIFVFQDINIKFMLQASTRNLCHTCRFCMLRVSQGWSQVLIGQDLIFFSPTWPKCAVTFLENVRWLNIKWGKKLGFQSSHTQPHNHYQCLVQQQKLLRKHSEIDTSGLFSGLLWFNMYFHQTQIS